MNWLRLTRSAGGEGTVTQTLLAVYAHPDDEVFGVGGTLHHYSRRGVRVVLACATRGEAGEISDPALATPETLGQVREQELRASAQALGVHEVVLLGHRDSGMEGTPPNQNPHAYINLDPGAAVRQIVALIRQERPQVVLTFEPFGGYGHPDHRAVSRHTTAAFDAAGSADHWPDAGEPWKPSRLFYSLIPNQFYRDVRARLAARGVDISTLRRTDELPGRPSDDIITTVIDVSASVAAKFRAAEAHRTQFGPESTIRRLPPEDMAPLIAREYFQMARPAPPAAAPVGDLFEGLL